MYSNSLYNIKSVPKSKNILKATFINNALSFIKGNTKILLVAHQKT